MQINSIKNYIFFSLRVFFAYFIIFINTSHASTEVQINIENDSNGIRVGMICQKNVDFEISQKGNNFIASFKSELSPLIKNISEEASKDLQGINQSQDKKSIIFSMVSDKYEVMKTSTDDGFILSITRIDLKNNQSQKDFKDYVFPVQNPLRENLNLEPSKKIDIPQKTIIKNITTTINKVNKDNKYLKTTFNFLADQTGQWVFNWDKDVASAVFIREHSLWIIFNEKKNIDLQPIKNAYEKYYLQGDQLENADFTVIKIRISNINSVRAYKKNFDWVIEIKPLGSKDCYTPKNKITQYNTAFSKGIFFPITQMYESILTIIDPDVGDILSVLTLYKSDYGVERKRNFVDFKLYSSAQGFVTNFLSDNSYMQIIKPGVEIIVPKNRFLQTNTSKNPDVIKTDTNQYKSRSIISIPAEDSAQYNINKSRIDQEIMLSSDLNLSQNYYKLSKFYFSNNMFAESASALKIVEKLISPSSSKELLMLFGISEFMRNRNVTANNIFTKINNNSLDSSELKEVSFWKNFLKIQVTGKGDPIDLANITEGFGSGYPNKIKEALAIKYVEYSIESSDSLSDIKNVCKTFESKTANDNFRNSMKYYLGLIEKKSGNEEQALKIWKDLSENHKDRYNSTLAKFSYIELLHDKKIISDIVAIDEFSRLSMRWRGDEVEIKILKKLGDLYYEQKKYAEALKIWKSLVMNFPDTGQSLFISSKMSEAFVELFGSEENNINLADLDAVSLFYEFKELMPIGKMGDKITSYIIKKMINLDLLSKAATLLLHQIEYRYEGIEKINAISELALVYIMDRKPENALKIIAKTDGISMDFETYQNIKHLKAEASIHLEKYVEALELLKDDFSDIGNNMKIYIFLRQNNWINLKRAILVTLDGREGLNQPLTDLEMHHIEHLALAFYMLHDIESIKNILLRFNNLLGEETPTKSLLKFLASDNKYINIKEITKTYSDDYMNDFLKKYKKSLISPKIL